MPRWLLIDHSKLATDLTIARLAQAGVVPIDIMATLSELQGSWNRPDAEQWRRSTPRPCRIINC